LKKKGTTGISRILLGVENRKITEGGDKNARAGKTMQKEKAGNTATTRERVQRRVFEIQSAAMPRMPTPECGRIG